MCLVPCFGGSVYIRFFFHVFISNLDLSYVWVVGVWDWFFLFLLQVTDSVFGTEFNVVWGIYMVWVETMFLNVEMSFKMFPGILSLYSLWSKYSSRGFLCIGCSFLISLQDAWSLEFHLLWFFVPVFEYGVWCPEFIYHGGNLIWIRPCVMISVVE